VKALEALGFVRVRAGTHVSMARRNQDGSSTPLTMPNHARLKASTIRAICTQSGIARDEFLAAYDGT
jgi:predicted RNA binding protein YcfA (HicA-like mRNA interferase family)